MKFLFLFFSLVSCVAQTPIRATPNNLYITHGSSMTAGVGAGGQTHANVVASMITRGLLPGYVCAINTNGINGQGFNYVYDTNLWNTNLINGATNEVDNKRMTTAGSTNWLEIWEGTNGMLLNNETASEEFALLTNYIACRLAQGWPADHILFVATLPRQGNDYPAFETNRIVFTHLCSNGLPAWGIKWANLTTNELIGTNGCQSNLTYYDVDRIHINKLGQDIAGTNIAKSWGFIP